MEYMVLPSKLSSASTTIAWKHPKPAGPCLHKPSRTRQTQIRLAESKTEPQVLLSSTQSETPQTTHTGSNNGVQSPGEGNRWNSTPCSQRVVKSLAAAAETLIPLYVTSKYRPGSSADPGTTVTIPHEKSILEVLQNNNSTF